MGGKKFLGFKQEINEEREHNLPQRTPQPSYLQAFDYCQEKKFPFALGKKRLTEGGGGGAVRPFRHCCSFFSLKKKLS